MMPKRWISYDILEFHFGGGGAVGGTTLLLKRVNLKPQALICTENIYSGFSVEYDEKKASVHAARFMPGNVRYCKKLSCSN